MGPGQTYYHQKQLTAGQADSFPVQRGLMVVIQFIMGFIMGIYLIEIVCGHLATKRVLAALKAGGSPGAGREDHNGRNHFGDNSG
jgi:hypothetical protein